MSQFQLKQIRIMRRLAELDVKKAEESGDAEKVAAAQDYLKLAIESEREVEAIMRENGIPPEPDDA